MVGGGGHTGVKTNASSVTGMLPNSGWKTRVRVTRNVMKKNPKINTQSVATDKWSATAGRERGDIKKG